ncbi:ornithine cyclodeaminase family protein [Amycolatopsis halotolerans]|uniref:Ornithine cyclodeaminase family protein n=1 Tax=Amycolatopsis halotolerans TaxID=330083 RepID=A0ABV7QLR0_9PSEU
MIVLNPADVRELLPMADAVDLMRTAFRAFSDGAVEQPVRHMVHSPSGDVLAVMPAHVSEGEYGFGLKAVSVVPENAERGLPVHAGLVLVFDHATGQPCALASGAAITAIRTAAASAAATDALARPDASTLAILGSGVQARSHLEAMTIVRPPKTVSVWNHRRETAERFAEWAGERVDCPVEVCATAAEAASGADVVCTVTASAEPVLAVADAGAHLNAVGSSFPDARELTGELVGRCRVFADSRESATRESGDLLAAVAEGHFAMDRIQAEIGEVLAGRHPGRESADEVTLFKSLGLAAQDVYSGLLLHRRAAATGIGTLLDFADADE